MRGRGSRTATLTALAIASGTVVGAGACAADGVGAVAALPPDAGALEDSPVAPAVDGESDSPVSDVPPSDGVVAAYQTGPGSIAVDSSDAGDAGRVYFTAGPCNGTLVLSAAK